MDTEEDEYLNEFYSLVIKFVGTIKKGKFLHPFCCRDGLNPGLPNLRR